MTTDDTRTAITYDDYWGLIKVNGLCVTDVGNGAQVQLQQCTRTFRQLWKAETDDRLRNMGTHRCLKNRADACESRDEQKWFWFTTRSVHPTSALSAARPPARAVPSLHSLRDPSAQ